MNLTTGRAPRMAPDERRAAILDAAIPLFMAGGADVTTRQIADAAGIAEGTLFRVFPDKDALIAAVVKRFMDPGPMLAALDAIELGLPLEETIARVVAIVRTRFAGVMGIMHALGLKHPTGAHGRHKESPAVTVLPRLLEPHREALRLEPDAAIQYIRLLCFASSVPPIAGDRVIPDDELVDFILHGISRKDR